MGETGGMRVGLPFDPKYLRRAFTSAAQSAGMWGFTAQQLAYAANVLWRHHAAILKRAQTSDLLPHKALHTYFSGVIFLLLAGMAIENLLKALIIAHQGLDVSSGKLPREIRLHDLSHLAGLAGVGLSEDEKELCEWLEAHAVWVGRYPVPTHVTKMLPARGGLDPKDRERFRRLFARLEKILIQAMRAREK